MRASAGADEPTLDAGEVAVPVALATDAHAGALHTGAVIDLIAVPRTEDHRAQVVARDATVLSIASGGFGAQDASVVVIAVPRADALAIADAMSAATFTAWITSTIPPATADAR